MAYSLFHEYVSTNVERLQGKEISIFEMRTILCCGKWVRHHRMTCPQVADGGTASNMEGRCKYIE